MKINSEQVSDTLSSVISSLINNGFEIAHKNTTVNEVAKSALQDTIEGISSAVDFSSDNEESIGLSDIKNGIYSIIYAGLASGFESVEETDDNKITAALSSTKEAALSKSKQVIPEFLCDRIQSQVSSSFANSRENVESKVYKSSVGKNATILAHDSAELLANKGIENLHSVLSGEITAFEAVESSLKDTASEIKDKAISDVLSKTIDKIGVGNYTDADEILTKAREIIDGETTLTDVAKEKAYLILQDRVSDSLIKRRNAIESKNYKSNTKRDSALFMQDSIEVLASRGVENLQGVLSGDVTLTEAIDITVTDAKKEISDKAINSAINKACDKIGIGKYLDPTAVIDTAKNVKDCFVEYMNGEITYPQFFLKIGQDGLYQVAQAWGTSIGTSIVVSTGMHGVAAAITAAASSTIITAVYSELYKYAVNVFEEEIASEQRLNEIKALSAEAISVIHEEREFLLNSTFIQAEKRQKVFNESLNSLSVALDTGNVELLTEALNQITTEVGGTIQFKSFEEFDEFMLDDSLALEF